jgi:hypothetical protein
MAYRSPEQRLRDLPDDFADAPGQPRQAPRPEQLLAASVIAQALHDAAGHLRVPREIRLGASAFLSGSEQFAFWCRVANLNPAAVAQLARQVLTETAARRRQLRAVGRDRQRARALLTPDDSTPPEAA